MGTQAFHLGMCLIQIGPQLLSLAASEFKKFWTCAAQRRVVAPPAASLQRMSYLGASCLWLGPPVLGDKVPRCFELRTKGGIARRSVARAQTSDGREEGS